MRGHRLTLPRILQALVLPVLLRYTSEKAILVVAMLASTAQVALFAAAPYLSAAAAYGGVAIGALGTMSFPIVSALKSVNAHEGEQGRVQGALFGAKALAQGIGPLIFSALFTYYAQPQRYFPSAPMVGLSVLMAAGAAVATAIQTPRTSARDLPSSAHNVHNVYCDESRLLGADTNDEVVPLVPREDGKHGAVQSAHSVGPGRLDAGPAYASRDEPEGSNRGVQERGADIVPWDEIRLCTREQPGRTASALQERREARHARWPQSNRTASRSSGAIDQRELELTTLQP